METFSTLLAVREGNPQVNGGFPKRRPVTRSFDVFFKLLPNKRLSKELRPHVAHYDVTAMHHSLQLYNEA